MRPHHLLACLLDIALSLPHLRRDCAELLDWEANALGKGRELPAHLGDLDGIIALGRILLFDPVKLPMLMLKCRSQIGDPIRVQLEVADFAGNARQEIVQLDAIVPAGATATSQRGHPLLAEGPDLLSKRGNALEAPHRLRWQLDLSIGGAAGQVLVFSHGALLLRCRICQLVGGGSRQVNEIADTQATLAQLADPQPDPVDQQENPAQALHDSALARLNALGQRHLLRAREQLYVAHLAKVEIHQIAGERAVVVPDGAVGACRRLYGHELLPCRGIHAAVQAREIIASVGALRCVIIRTQCGDDILALDAGALEIFLKPVLGRQSHLFLVILWILNRAEASTE
ncbi:MAG TPA: hypothetical protein VFZ16_08815 [Hyphomicrobiaceae bacterium]|nr:hypothetical protein [Hyphomicrobiaceae bacterium]